MIQHGVRLLVLFGPPLPLQVKRGPGGGALKVCVVVGPIYLSTYRYGTRVVERKYQYHPPDR